MLLEVGQVCFKTKGRTQGDKVVIVETRKDGQVVIEGLHTKRKPCNPRHLFPTSQKIGLSKETKREEILKLLKA
jgi:ribosomal protein L14E/L6E/L27E